MSLLSICDFLILHASRIVLRPFAGKELASWLFTWSWFASLAVFIVCIFGCLFQFDVKGSMC